jgi:hypothetical protein
LDLFFGESMAAYLCENDVRVTGVWASEREIIGAASLLNVDILVYSKIGSTMSWLCYPALLSLNALKDLAIFLFPANNHFDVVLAA